MIALALLAAPSAAFAAIPVAAVPHHDMQAMQMDHCQSAPSSSDRKAPVKSCCMSMCMALAVAPEPAGDAMGLAHFFSYFVGPTSWHGYLGEIATPPPKLS
jgi:hypothetical protein